MNICSSPALLAVGQDFEMFETRFHGKNVQVALVWTLAGIEAAFAPDTTISHMRYIGDVEQVLDYAGAGDCVVLLCANQALSTKVRSVLHPVA